jgi:xanthine dehydrogenase accessory factor
MDPVIQKAYQAALQGHSYAFATVIEATQQGTPRKPGAKMVVSAEGGIVGTIGGGLYERRTVLACQKAIKTGKPEVLTFESFGKKGQGICGGKFRVFIEPFSRTRHLIICGAGHISLPFSFIAKLLNFRITVIDERNDWANKNRFPHADSIIVGLPEKSLQKLTYNSDTYVFIATHEHKHDYACLKILSRFQVNYIGLIASKQKRLKFFKALVKLGVSKAFLSSINTPAGLDIGAQTPEEIAISVAAEIVMKYNKKWLKSEKFSEKLKGVNND